MIRLARLCACIAMIGIAGVAAIVCSSDAQAQPTSCAQSTSTGWRLSACSATAGATLGVVMLSVAAKGQEVSAISLAPSSGSPTGATVSRAMNPAGSYSFVVPKTLCGAASMTAKIISVTVKASLLDPAAHAAGSTTSLGVLQVTCPAG